jgi:ABC-type branched-subunit amino acid transport system ATPase component
MDKVHGLSFALEMTVLMVEQNVRAVFRVVERVDDLDLGKIICDERPDTLLH